jgi:hypothetical protein
MILELYQVRLMAHNKNYTASPCPRVSPNDGYLTGHDITPGIVQACHCATRSLIRRGF